MAIAHLLLLLSLSVGSAWRYEVQLRRVTSEVPNIPGIITPWQLSLSGVATSSQAPSNDAGHNATRRQDPQLEKLAVAEIMPGQQQDLATIKSATIPILQRALDADAVTACNVSEQPGNTAQQGGHRDVGVVGQSSEGSVALMPSSAAANEASAGPPKSTRAPAALAGLVAAAGAGSASGGVRSQHYPSRLVHVSAENVGTYGFKGCGAMDMVSLTADVLPPVPDNTVNKARKGGKGKLVPALVCVSLKPGMR